MLENSPCSPPFGFSSDWDRGDAVSIVLLVSSAALGFSSPWKMIRAITAKLAAKLAAIFKTVDILIDLNW